MGERMRIKYIDEVQYCCKEMKKFYDSHNDIKLDWENNCIIVDGNSIDECPFCHANIEVDVSVAHWGP